MDVITAELAQLVKHREGTERGGADAPPRGAPPAPSGLPCRNSNNCPKPTTPKGYKLRQTATVFKGPVGMAQKVTTTATGGAGEGLDNDGRGWQFAEGDKGTLERVFGGITSAEAKRAFALRQNVEAFTEYYAHANCGFLTLTPEDGTMTPREFGRAWHQMCKHDLAWLRSYVRVIEAQKRGAPHYHLCVATPYDLHPAAFDWEALKGSAEARRAGDFAKARELTKQYAKTATDDLRAIWAELRAVCPRYGLGRSEFLPFRKSAGAVAHYIGKYLEGGLRYKNAEWKGARRVEYDRTESKAWKRCASSFAWVSEGAKAWRQRVGELAVAIGADGPEDLVRILGSKWAYHARPTIMTEAEPEWRRLLSYWADKHGGRVDRKDGLRIGGELLAWFPSSADGVDDLGIICTPHSPLGVC